MLYQMFEEYLKTGDFVGADMARKFLQMGYTRARRYANYRGGIKYDKNNAYALKERGTGDPGESGKRNDFPPEMEAGRSASRVCHSKKDVARAIWMTWLSLIGRFEAQFGSKGLLIQQAKLLN